MRKMSRDEVTFEIIKHYGVIAEESRGWKKELNLVSWNGGVPKVDIRSWDEDHAHASKGLTLTEDEAKVLLSLLSENFEK